MSLLMLPSVRREIDPVGIVTLWYDDATYQCDSHTAFVDIKKLMPGHRLSLQKCGKPCIKRYWHLQRSTELHLRNEVDYIEAFRDVFGGAVDRAARGSVDTALMLGGGIDSSAILAARKGFERNRVAVDITCISAVLAPEVDDRVSLDEHRNIREILANHSPNIVFQVPVPGDLAAKINVADLAEIAWSWIHPVDASLLVPAIVCRLASERGIRLVLNGVDGDNVTSTSVFYIDELVRKGRWHQAWRESGMASSVNTYLAGTPRWQLFFRAALSRLEPSVLRRLRSWLHTSRTVRTLPIHEVMSPDLATASNLANRLWAAREKRNRAPEIHRLNNMAYWLSCSMEGSNQIASRFGVEVRHPWCDRKVVDFFARLPEEWRTKKGWTKYLVRKSCESALGSKVVWHSGKGHLGYWLNQQAVNDAAPYLSSLLLDQRSALRGLVREESVLEMSRILGDASRTWPVNDVNDILKVAALAGWLRNINAVFNHG